MPRRILWLVPAVLAATCCWAGDWPQFRGPGGEGHADEKLVTEWSGAGWSSPIVGKVYLHILWKVDVPGSGWSSPVVVGGKVYLTSAVPVKDSKDLSLRAICLNAKDGKTVWDVEVFRQDAKKAPGIHRKNSHASPTPSVEGERLYVHFGHQGTACLDLSGKVKWRNSDLRYSPVHGNGGSPVLVDGLLVFSTDGARVRQVIALDVRDGQVKWKKDRSGKAARAFSFSTPLVITVGGKKQIVSPASDMVAAYDPATGEEIWKVTYSGYSVIPRPVFGHGMVFLSTGFDRPELLAIAADGKGDVTKTHVKWRIDEGAPKTPSPLLVGDELYLVSDDGFASCLDAKKGTQHWSKRVPGNGFSASPLYANGHVYLQSEDGVGTVLKASKKYELVSRNDLPKGSRTLASYAASGGALFLRTQSELYKIGK
jgi:outer membrane protein assembly factor BamB